MNQPGGSHCSQERSCLRTDATGSCSSSVEVRARTATGTGSAGPVPVMVPGAACADVTIPGPP
jgi:hypothetical protein